MKKKKAMEFKGYGSSVSYGHSKRVQNMMKKATSKQMSIAQTPHDMFSNRDITSLRQSV